MGFGFWVLPKNPIFWVFGLSSRLLITNNESQNLKTQLFPRFENGFLGFFWVFRFWVFGFLGFQKYRSIFQKSAPVEQIFIILNF